MVSQKEQSQIDCTILLINPLREQVLLECHLSEQVFGHIYEIEYRRVVDQVNL